MNQSEPKTNNQEDFDYNEGYQSRSAYVPLKGRVYDHSGNYRYNHKYDNTPLRDKRFQRSYKSLFAKSDFKLTDTQMFLVNVVIFALCVYVFVDTIAYSCPGKLLSGAMGLVLLLFIKRLIEEKFYD